MIDDSSNKKASPTVPGTGEKADTSKAGEPPVKRCRRCRWPATKNGLCTSHYYGS